MSDKRYAVYCVIFNNKVERIFDNMLEAREYAQNNFSEPWNVTILMDFVTLNINEML